MHCLKSINQLQQDIEDKISSLLPRPFSLHAAETNFGRSARSRSVLTLHKIRQIDCGWEAFISSFAGALT